MQPGCEACPSSRQGLHVGAHHVGHAPRLGSTMKLIHGRLLLRHSASPTRADRRDCSDPAVWIWPALDISSAYRPTNLHSTRRLPLGGLRRSWSKSATLLVREATPCLWSSSRIRCGDTIVRARQPLF
jgi:hypothetical protein